jgi:hypothetical protein
MRRDGIDTFQESRENYKEVSEQESKRKTSNRETRSRWEQIIRKDV